MPLRVLVVDDTILFRTVVADALRTLPGVEVVGTAANGRLALMRIEELHPDLMTLDIEMPGMDGFQVLDELRRIGSGAGVIIVSSRTVSGSMHTVKALEKGAFDFITKPAFDSIEKNRSAVIEALAPRVKAFERRQQIRNILQGTPSAPKLHPVAGGDAPQGSDLATITKNMQRIAGISKPEILLIGVSTGGPAALALLLPAIPADIGLPIVIVQHMPPMFTNALAESLNEKCSITVREAAHGDILRPDTAYIAPGGKQIRFEMSPASVASIAVTDDPPENNCKPSVDYMFRSAAHTLSGGALAVILTGMGNDGTIGLRLLKRHGCFVIAQDEATCVVYGMPKAAVEAGIVDETLPLERIASRIVSLVRRGTV